MFCINFNFFYHDVFIRLRDQYSSIDGSEITTRNLFKQAHFLIRTRVVMVPQRTIIAVRLLGAQSN